MKTIIRHLVCALALTGTSLTGWGQQPSPAPQGKVAILANDRILQGDIELVGKQYRIRRSIGESWLPAEQVRCLCATLADAFAYLRAQANLKDGDERLRLARWCHLHGLKREAAEEAAAAVQLRPEHAESQRLLKGMQRSLANDSNAADQVKEEADPETALPNLPYNASSLGLFVNKVQPILMNACARCHACGKGGSYKLARVYDDGGLGNRRLTQQNLMATLAYLNRDRSQTSPLLSYSLKLHGNAELPPLPSRTAPAYRTLEEWVQQAMSGLPRSVAAAPPAVSGEAKAVAVAPAATAPAVAPGSPPGVAAPVPANGATWITKWQPPKESVEPAKEPTPPTAAVVNTPAPSATEFAKPRADAEKPATDAAPTDPFDPMIFNRQMHPGR